MQQKKWIGFLFLLFAFILFFKTEESQAWIEETIETIEKEEETYYAILEIPKLNLKRELYPIGDKKNTVSKNIEIIEGSTMPDEKFNNLILAAHSGTSSIAYFKHLDKLKLHDEANIFYKKKKYTYKLVDVYQEIKDGTITIHREKEKSHLTLITCDKKSEKYQNVYIFERK